MSKFNELMKQDHVRNHPMFQGFDDRLKAMRANMSRKFAAPDLKDIFSSQKAVGLGTNDRSVRAYIQEAAVSARSVLDMCDFPMQPVISFNNVKSVRMAAHDDSQVVDAEILFNVRIMTKSGAIRQALLPVVVSRGVVVPPSTLIYDQQMKVIAQSTIDEIVQRNTSYQLPPMRRMYDPPLRGEELDRAASERNTLGWMPREVVTDGMGIRHSRRQAQVSPEPDEGDYIIHEVSTGEADSPGEYHIEVVGYGEEEFEGQSYNSLDEAMDAIRGVVFLGGRDPDTSIWLVDAHGRTTRVGWELDHGPEREEREARRQAQGVSPDPNTFTVVVDGETTYQGADQAEAQQVAQQTLQSTLESEVYVYQGTNPVGYFNPGDPQQSTGFFATILNDIIPYKDSSPEGIGRENRDLMQGIYGEQPMQHFTTYARRLMGEDQTNPGTPSSLANPPAADATQSDATQISNPATDPTMVGVPGGEKSMGQYAQGENATADLYRQILAQPTITQQVQEILNPSPATLINNISQMISPLMSVLSLRTEDIDWDYLLDDLRSSLSGVTASKIGKAEVRKAALMIAEYVTGRRRFGRRRAAADTASAITEMMTYLQSAQDTFKPDELAYYQQIAQEAQSALQGGDEQTARDLLVELENAFSFTDVPQEQEVPTDYWNTFTATCKKLAQQTNLVKENEVDEDDNKPMKRYMPAGYDLVLEDMVKAEEDGLDSFPRPYSHIERNYILRRYPTCSRDKWLPHLINDGFALNPYGKGPNRGRPVREGSKRAGQAPNIIANLGDVNFIEYGGLLVVDNGDGPEGWYIEEPISTEGTAEWTIYRFPLDKIEPGQDEWFMEDLGSVASFVDSSAQMIVQDFASDDVKLRARAYMDVGEYFGFHEFDQYPMKLNAKEVHELFGEEYHGDEDDELEEEPEEGFGEEPEAPIEPKLSRSAQVDDEPEEEMGKPTLYLDNLDHDDGMVTVHIEGPNAAAWVFFEQDIQGSWWETTGDDFAYAIIADSPTLLEDLKKDGYLDLNTDSYSPPTLEDLQALDPMNG